MLRDHGLPEEDGLLAAMAQRQRPSGAVRLRVAVLAPPHISNLDEFQPLLVCPAVRWLGAHAADWKAPTGSCCRAASRSAATWPGCARRAGGHLRAHVAAGGRCWVVCGGLQMLGEGSTTPRAWTASPRPAAGPGPAAAPHPLCRAQAAARRRARFAAELPAAWSALAGLQVPGYEIRCGQTEGPGAVAWADDGQPLAWAQGSVLGLYLHGALEQPALLRALCGAAVDGLDAVFDRLAEHLEGALGRDKLMRLCTP
jgi:adenosylcobyric acid synthase